MGNNLAIVIGINQYERLTELKYAKQDALKIKELLEELGEVDRVYLFTDDSQPIDGKPTKATHTNLRDLLVNLFEEQFLKAEDNLWFFFSGHGLRCGEQDYLIPIDGNPRDIDGTGITVDFVTKRLSKSGAGNIVLILDACRNALKGAKGGGEIGNDAEACVRERGLISIFSCRPDEQSWEDDDLEQGVFTFALTKALREGGCATVQQINSYLKNEVAALSRQHGRPLQTPWLVAQPIEKADLILVPKHARQRDLEKIKNLALELETEDNLERALELWTRVNIAAQGRDTQFYQALPRIQRKLEKERSEAKQRENERLEIEQREKARVEAERLEKERSEDKQRENERLEIEQREKARVEAERLEKEHSEAKQRENERLEIEQREKARVETERLEKERSEAKQRENERLDAERRKREGKQGSSIGDQIASKFRRLAERSPEERKKAVFLLVLVLIALVGSLVVWIMSHGRDATPLTTTTAAQPSPTPIAQRSVAKESNFYWTPAPGVIGAGATIIFVGSSNVGKLGGWTEAAAEEWAQKTGNKIQYISRPNDASATLQEYQQYWAARSSDVDVFMVDAIWQGILAPHAVNLKKYFKEDEVKAFFPRIIQNNTVGGKLVSIPWFTDAGLLYYRTDLLEKYGYKEPPKTWEELADMAKKIQDGERKAGNPDFQGFVFQGKASESVTCNAIEWIYSYGGGTIVEPDKKVTINNPKAIEALETAKSWVGTISPLGVITYGEEEARNVWQGGHAAFMRNWPYAYALGADPESPIAGKFDISVLPKGGDDGKNAACLGGWQLMVSAYSHAPDVAADLVRYLTCSQLQKKLAVEISLLPTLTALYSDSDVLAKNPYFKNILPALENTVARPSTVTGADYNVLSTAFFQNVNRVLSGGATAQQAVSKVEKVARDIMRNQD